MAGWLPWPWELCSCSQGQPSPSGDVHGLHFGFCGSLWKCFALIQQIFESLLHLGVWRGQRTESQSTALSIRGQRCPDTLS